MYKGAFFGGIGMDISFIISPVAGAVIGYFTNWLAIKMLFRPHNEIRIGSFRVPFTPGLIPKEKARIAESLGDTVGNYLLTGEVLAQAVAKPEISDAVKEAAERIEGFLKTSEKSIGDYIGGENGKEEIYLYVKKAVAASAAAILSGEGFSKNVTDIIFSRIKEFMELEIAELEIENYKDDIKYASNILFKTLSESEDVKEGIERCLWDYLIGMKDNEVTLGESVSPESIGTLKDYISVKAPEIANGILKIIEEPDVDELLRDKVRVAIGRNAGVLGMFINTESIYDKVIFEIRDFFNNPENGPEIDRAVDMFVDKVLSYTVGQAMGLLTGEMREITVKRLVEAALKAALTDEASDTVVDKIMSYAQKEGNRPVKELIYDFMPEFDSRAYDKLYVAVSDFLKKDAYGFIDTALDSFLEGIMKCSIKDLGNKIGDETFENIKAVIVASYSPIAVKAAPYVVEAINIPKIVEERINSFDMDHIEKLILNIASTELKAITWVGGVLGFIIGFVPVLTQLIGL